MWSLDVECHIVECHENDLKGNYTLDMIMEILITHKQNEKVDVPSHGDVWHVTRTTYRLANRCVVQCCSRHPQLLKYSSPRKCYCAKYAMWFIPGGKEEEEVLGSIVVCDSGGGSPFHHDDLDYWPSSNKVCLVVLEPLRMMTMANVVSNGLQSEYMAFFWKINCGMYMGGWVCCLMWELLPLWGHSRGESPF